VLASGEAYKNIYGLDPATAIVPFSQPAIITPPLGFIAHRGVAADAAEEG
jgi:cation/acetate symporter